MIWLCNVSYASLCRMTSAANNSSFVCRVYRRCRYDYNIYWN